MFIISDLMNYISGLGAETVQIISSIAAVIASIVAIVVVFLTRYLSERDLKRKCVDALLSEIMLDYREVGGLENYIEDVINDIDPEDDETSLLNKTKFHSAAFHNFLLNGYLIQTSDDLYESLSDFYIFLNLIEEGLKNDNYYFIFFHSDPDLAADNRIMNCNQMLENIKILKGLYEDDLMPYIVGDEKIL